MAKIILRLPAPIRYGPILPMREQVAGCARNGLESFASRLVNARIFGDAIDTNNKEPSTMPRAMWKEQVIAESDDTVVVEGNHYFPQASLHRDFFKSSSTTSVCGWKGTAQYFDIEVNGQVNRDAAWYYPDPKPDAENIRDRVAFWRGVQVE